MPGLGARHWTLTGPLSSLRFNMSAVYPNQKKLSTFTGVPCSKLYSVEMVSLASCTDSPMWSGHCPPSPTPWQMNRVLHFSMFSALTIELGLQPGQDRSENSMGWDQRPGFYSQLLH